MDLLSGLAWNNRTPAPAQEMPDASDEKLNKYVVGTYVFN